MSTPKAKVLDKVHSYEERSCLAEAPSHIGAVLEINLKAVRHNYHYLQAQLATAQCAAVVKADAYGLGIEPIGISLKDAGCKHFFVALLEEALSLRAQLPDVEIYVSNGLFQNSEDLYSQYRITPVLNDLAQISLWQRHAKKLERKLPAIIQVETGIWRAGLSPQEIRQLSLEPDRLEGIDLKYIMSHLACSEQRKHPKNEEQLGNFHAFLSMLPQAKASFANSHGIFLGPQYHFDLVRPGRSLYGLGTHSIEIQNLKPAIYIFARIIQIREVGRGETIGYDATYTVGNPVKLATVSIGYADGILRSLTNRGIVYINGFPAPIIGRVSMDLMTLDVSQVPSSYAYPGGWAEIIGDHVSADELAHAAGSNSREILVNLGKRYHRVYKYD